ncbi:MAG TPA: DUF1501 domain-containing protein, partial [Tepidisphaeraceae bacterium]
MSLYDHRRRIADRFLTRRQLLSRCGMGFGALALGDLLTRSGAFGAEAVPSAIAGAQSKINPLYPKGPHFPPKAKRIIHLFMNGGPSQVDTFDPKPMLDK